MTRRTATPRGGFTMIELLVVILIIAILASLLTVAITRVQAAAKRAAAAAEIAQIANAIGAFKAKTNVGYIPSGGSGKNGEFQLRKQYAGNEFEIIYLKQLFPQLPYLVGPQVPGDSRYDPNGTGLPDVDLDANQTLVFFLTGGKITNYSGFSTNRRSPFETTAESRIGPFLTFSESKYASGAAAITAFRASSLASPDDRYASSLVDPWGSPYAYFAFNPGTNKYMDTGFVFRGVTVLPYVFKGKMLEPKGFQIISAGENGPDDTAPFGFGPGGVKWTPQLNEYAEGGAGADDVANFNNGPLVIQN